LKNKFNGIVLDFFVFFWFMLLVMRQQITRLLIAFSLFIVALVTARHYLVPKTFGKLGHYRAAAIDDNVSRKIKYAGHEACAMCHEDIVKTHDSHRHANVACEVCHGPSAAHVEAPTDVRPQAPRERGYCPLCHGYNPSRPTGFPQIDPVTHNPMKPCYTCHNPHEPEPPRTPEECSACHGEIAKTKAVSHHALLPCTRCHQADTQHKISPRTSRPTKPSTRAFCGECHARDANAAKEIPRVDIATHGERYMCWQCHYPHFPELK
jgi:ribosomal protein S27AE